MLNTKTKSVLFWNRNWNNSHDKLSDFLSIPVQYKIRYLLKFEFELESLNSEKYSESDSGIDSSPGIMTPLNCISICISFLTFEVFKMGNDSPLYLIPNLNLICQNA